MSKSSTASGSVQLTPRLDFRSEALVSPTEEMWAAMKQASSSLGMSSLREDPAVAALEERVAELVGQDDALLVPSVTAGTLSAFLATGIRGEKVVLESRSHLWWMQDQHFSVFAGGTPVGIRGDRFGQISLETLEEELSAEAYNRRLRTALVCLENTHNVSGGTVLSPVYTRDVAMVAHDSGAKLFIDGARIFDAAVAQGIEVAALTADADIVVLSLNKALGAPYGAVLSGSRSLIASARVESARIGALQVHKSGMLAAAANLALDGFVDRVSTTHELAKRLAAGLSGLDRISVDMDTVQTNLVMANIAQLGVDQGEFVRRLSSRGVGAKAFLPGLVRFTLHADHNQDSVDEAIDLVREIAALH